MNTKNTPIFFSVRKKISIYLLSLETYEFDMIMTQIDENLIRI
jgi:hypothetical protein